MNSLPEAPIQGGNDEPLYNIGVVTRLTGISMATLRAWERRYAFPESSRTSGGHRLYTENDVLRLRWVKGRIEDGMQTSQAIHALHVQEQRGTDIYHAARVETAERTNAGWAALDGLKHKLVEALLERRVDQADLVMGEALASSSPEELILRMIVPALTEIGEAWFDKRINITSEHFSTNYLRQRLIMWILNGPPPQSGPPVILACAPGEWHEGSLLVLGALLRRRRIPIAYLGQTVPLTDLNTFIRDIRPQIVVLVAMQEETAAQLTEWPQWLPEAASSGKPIIGYGGRAFTLHPEWRLRMQGVYLGDTLEAGLEKIVELAR
jgi:MerR family transcriptional regulator, light-induced transcriptional regulator